MFIYQFFQLSLFLRSAVSTYDPLPLVFRKLVGMTAFYFDFHCLSAEKYFSSFLYCCSLYFSDTECGQILHFSRPRQTQTLSSLLKWKKRLVKDVRLSLPLTEVMKIARLTSPLPDVLRLSSPKPRLRHGRRLALLSPPNLTPNRCTLAFVLSLALLPHLPLLLSPPTVSLSRSRLRSTPIT